MKIRKPRSLEHLGAYTGALLAVLTLIDALVVYGMQYESAPFDAWWVLLFMILNIPFWLGIFRLGVRLNDSLLKAAASLNLALCLILGPISVALGVWDSSLESLGEVPMMIIAGIVLVGIPLACLLAGLSFLRQRAKFGLPAQLYAMLSFAAGVLWIIPFATATYVVGSMLDVAMYGLAAYMLFRWKRS